MGLIPAGAGQIWSGASFSLASRAHPRRCGADATTCLPSSAPRGSSPQVRGRSSRLRHGCKDVGLIPAGAGQICRRKWQKRTLGAHPRRCGADDMGHKFPRLPCRLIPAGAGQMQVFCWRYALFRAHPRRCGADPRPDPTRPVPFGSSPQVRGRSYAHVLPDSDDGLIPAGAGQMWRSPSRSRTKTAHPRRCGADLRFSNRRTRTFGSSPQVRGRFGKPSPGSTWSGLIPAGAGQITVLMN